MNLEMREVLYSTATILDAATAYGARKGNAQIPKIFSDDDFGKKLKEYIDQNITSVLKEVSSFKKLNPDFAQNPLKDMLLDISLEDLTRIVTRTLVNNYIVERHLEWQKPYCDYAEKLTRNASKTGTPVPDEEEKKQSPAL